MSKVMSLHDAIKTYVKSGDSLCFGGFTTNRKPYAAVMKFYVKGLAILSATPGLLAAIGIC